MKRHWIEYINHSRTFYPMTRYVHRRVRVKPGSKEVEIIPPFPAEVFGKGYPIFKVEIDGFIFEFASLDELRVCIDTLEQKQLPRFGGRSRAITRTPRPHRHWLNQLPAKVLKWKYREQAVKYLQKALKEFRKQGFSEYIAQPENDTT
jgi:hypothetical protein